MKSSSTASFQSRLLSRIAWLLFSLVLVLLLAFCFFASSFCITLLLGAFLAILLDPVVTCLERLQIPRPASAGLLIGVGMLFVGSLAYVSYNRASEIVDSLPLYTERMRQIIQPLDHKIAKVRETAGNLSPDPMTKKIAEVRISESPTWPSYLVRGVGTVWGGMIVIGILPFLVFFNLIRKEQMYQKLASTLDGTIDVPKFVRRVTRMVRGFTIGNMIVGFAMAGIIALVLLTLNIEGAVILGIISGFLNLVPFLGVIFAALIPFAAALVQSKSAGPFAIIILTVVTLHVISANFIIPKVIGSRVNIGPVAATMGILFWGWLWGPIGILLAVPLTSFVKIVADCHPSMMHISNILSESAPPGAPKRDCQQETVYKMGHDVPESLPAKIKS